MNQLKLKVCGMKDRDNIKRLIEVRPDFIGFIFYRKSPRYVHELDEELISRIPISIKKVGVFVNEEPELVMKLQKKYGLDYVQLHGDEDLTYIKALKEKGVGIIKVFRIMESLPYSMIQFEEYSDYFLFDTASAYYGGSGRHFDWNILVNYNLQTPFLLSGGIGVDDIEEIKGLNFPRLAGIDVNSKFELEPGKKDMVKVNELKKAI